MQQDSVDRHIEHWTREIPDLDPLTEGVVTRMQMVLQHLKQTRQALLAAHGLEEYEYATLHFLGGRGNGHRATPSDIAAWHKMSPSGITGRLDALEKRGFIRRPPSPADPQGNEEVRVLAALEPAEQAQLNEMLRRMMRVFDRPGLLDTPDSAAGDEAGATRSRSRFTPDAKPE